MKKSTKVAAPGTTSAGSVRSTMMTPFGGGKKGAKRAGAKRGGRGR